MNLTKTEKLLLTQAETEDDADPPDLPPAPRALFVAQDFAAKHEPTRTYLLITWMVVSKKGEVHYSKTRSNFISRSDFE